MEGQERRSARLLAKAKALSRNVLTSRYIWWFFRAVLHVYSWHLRFPLAQKTSADRHVPLGFQLADVGKLRHYSQVDDLQNVDPDYEALLENALESLYNYEFFDGNSGESDQNDDKDEDFMPDTDSEGDDSAGTSHALK